MKVLTTTGLTKLIELSKDTFLDKNNVIDVADALADVAVSGSYNDLSNKPSINNVTLTGNKTSANLGLQPTLVGSGTGQNIKTINSTSLLGSGNISITGLPSQSSQSGKFLTTDGTDASWASIPNEIPSQSGQSGKFLTTNGSVVSWGNVPNEIPSQSGQSGKFLTTNGTSISWGTVTVPTITDTFDKTSHDGMSGIAVASGIQSIVGIDCGTMSTMTKEITLA